MSSLDIVAGVKHVNHVLAGLGFTPRDADENDFQRGSDRHLRFKTGTMYGEVTVQVFVDNQRKKALRFLTDVQLHTAENQIRSVIRTYAEPEPERTVVSDGADNEIIEFVDEGLGGW